VSTPNITLSIVNFGMSKTGFDESFPRGRFTATIAAMKLPPRGAPPPDVVAKLRLTCLELPQAHEERAWAGIRWNIGRKSFAHALMIEEAWPPAYARAASIDDGCVCTFRLNRERCDAPRFRRAPFFRPVWFPNIAGVRIDARTDWDELEQLLKESFRVLAPAKLAALVE
jgi:hypothetical protein